MTPEIRTGSIMTKHLSNDRRRSALATFAITTIVLTSAACTGRDSAVAPGPGRVLKSTSAGPPNVAPDASRCLTTTCVYVTNIGTPSVTAYDLAASGDAVPLQTISGSSTALNDPQGVVLDTNHRLYIPNHFGQSVTLYPKGANGDVAPIKAIGGSNTGLNTPNGVALDPSRHIYVANGFEPTRGPGSVTVYAAGANGNVTPLRTISGANTRLDIPSDLALDSHGRIYVANSGSSNSVTVYAAGANGNASPIRTLRGANTGLSTPFGIAFDAGQRMYVTNAASNSITVYAKGSHGNVAPIRTIIGTNTEINIPEEIALDASGNIYVAICACGSVSGPSSVNVYAAGANGNVAPIRTISGIDTGLNQPVGITIH
jgi:6-phosphogluconolactonase (cycloisomerase 2 family)